MVSSRLLICRFAQFVAVDVIPQIELHGESIFDETLQAAKYRRWLVSHQGELFSQFPMSNGGVLPGETFKYSNLRRSTTQPCALQQIGRTPPHRLWPVALHEC